MAAPRRPQLSALPRDGRRGGGWLVGTSSGGGGGASGAGPARSPSSATGGKLSSVRAEDLRLRAPRGLLAHARAGEPARLELLAPLLGGGRVELPGRMRCVLHLRSPWYDPAAEAEPVEHVAVEETVQGERRWPRPGERGMGGRRRRRRPRRRLPRVGRTRRGAVTSLLGSSSAGASPSRRTRCSQARISCSRPGYAPPTGYAPPSVFDNALASASASHASHSPMRIEDASLRVQMSSKLKWGGESASLGGTLLLATFAVPRARQLPRARDLRSGAHHGLAAASARCAVRCGRTPVGSGREGAERGRGWPPRDRPCVAAVDCYGNARRISDDPPAGELTAELELLTAHDALFVDYDNALEQRQQRHLDALQQMARGGTAGHRGWHRHNGGGGDGEADHIGGIGEYRPSVVSSARATASVSALADGSFAVGYTVRQAGVWALSIGLEGEQIAKSPFAVTVWPGRSMLQRATSRAISTPQRRE